MADNLNFLDAAAASQVIAFDLVGGVYYQRSKMVWGVDGAVFDVSATNPLPVDTELTTGDLDTGAGTDTKAVVGLMLAASGGGVLLPGDATNGAKVQVATAPVVGRTADSISTAIQVDRLMNNLTAVVPTPLVISASSSGDNTLLAAQGSGNIILVHQAILVASAAVTAKFRNGTTDITGPMDIDAKSGFVLPFSPVGWFKTSANALLAINLGGAVQVGGVLGYTVVT